MKQLKNQIPTKTHAVVVVVVVVVEWEKDVGCLWLGGGMAESKHR